MKVRFIGFNMAQYRDTGKGGFDRSYNILLYADKMLHVDGGVDALWMANDYLTDRPYMVVAMDTDADALMKHGNVTVMDRKQVERYRWCNLMGKVL